MSPDQLQDYIEWEETTQLKKAKIYVVSEERATELRGLASAMKLEEVSIELLIEQSPEASKEQIADPKVESEELNLNSRQRYFEFSEGIRKGVIVPLLDGKHPELPKAEVKRMQVETGRTGELFREKEFVPVRVMAVKSFVEDENGKNT